MARTYNSGWRDWFNTKSANINNNFVVEGLVEQMEQLDKLLSTSPEMEKRIQTVIRKVLTKAQKRMQQEIHGDLPNDPRDAYKAVRKAVYRRILGGNINILRKKRAGSPSSYTPTRTIKSGQRGGNRRPRSERTMRMDSYHAQDRGFILRFLNSGTKGRVMGHFNQDPHRADVKRGSQGGDVNKYGNRGKVNTGNRGHIGPRNIFGSHLNQLGQYIDQALAEEFRDLMKDMK